MAMDSWLPYAQTFGSSIYSKLFNKVLWVPLEAFSQVAPQVTTGQRAMLRFGNNGGSINGPPLLSPAPQTALGSKPQIYTVIAPIYVPPGSRLLNFAVRAYVLPSLGKTKNLNYIVGEVRRQAFSGTGGEDTLVGNKLYLSPTVVDTIAGFSSLEQFIVDSSVYYAKLSLISTERGPQASRFSVGMWIEYQE